MRLKKLVIVGFKSFAERTIVHFDRGITCIVGPNGCGKSNIADAFRWVLGEQSARSMRGNKMPDVIFAGTHKRKPLNFAEVSLTLEDVKGALPIEYEEITLTRRLHRSGESEYLINGNIVRLKDIQSLFLDSGIGHQAFSIFEQGKLDQVISLSPLERRYIFEEAAGILRFLQRKKESLKRLEQADLNLSRVKDIHLEVEKQIQTLQVQAEKAIIYKKQQADLELLEKASFALRYESLDKKKLELMKKSESHAVTLQKRLDEYQHQKSEFQHLKQHLQENELKTRSTHDQKLRLNHEKLAQQREKEISQQQMNEALHKERHKAKELTEMNQAQDSRRQLLKELSKKKLDVEKECREAETKLQHQLERVKSQEKEVLQLREELQSHHQMHLKHVQQESLLNGEIKQTEVRLENNEDKKLSSEERQRFVDQEINRCHQLILEKKLQLQTASQKVEQHQERLACFEDELKIISEKQSALTKEIDINRKVAMENKARLKVLLKMREDHEGFSSGSKRLLQESNDPKSSLYSLLKPLYGYFTPAPESIEPMAIVMRNYAQTLVVETQEQFDLVIGFTKNHEIVDFSLICEEWIHPESLQIKHSMKSFSDSMKKNSMVEHFLNNVVIQNNDQAKIEQPGLETWCPQEGSYIDPHGVYFNIKPGQNPLFLREYELKTLEENLLEMDSVLNKLEHHHTLLQEKKTALLQERSGLDKTLRQDEMKLVEINFGLQRLVSDHEKMKIERVQREKERLELIEQIEKQGTSLKEAKDKQHLLKQDLESVLNIKEKIQKDLETRESSLKIQQQDHREKNTMFRQFLDNQRQMDHQSSLLDVKEQEHDKQVERINSELIELSTIQINASKKIEEIDGQLSLLHQAIFEVNQNAVELDKIKTDLSKQCQENEELLHRWQDSLKGLENEATQMQIQLAQVDSQLKSLIDELQSRYLLTLEDLIRLELPLTKSIDQTEKMIRSLRQALASSGDVNLTSIEELEKHQERFGFLNQQMSDMQSSKSELLEIITQLDKESRQMFRETFEKIRTNFKKNFDILFSGGEADLQFTETDNILEAGIEIIARPPGKQMRSISLLSGGEKCLTAVALLFAIFEVKPAPFCILDEIDAPLDDANVERFANVVKHFVEQCQFLIITHNKRTMAIADILFGVSMEERGVSKLLSLEFKDTPELSII